MVALGEEWKSEGFANVLEISEFAVEQLPAGRSIPLNSTYINVGNETSRSLISTREYNEKTKRGFKEEKESTDDKSKEEKKRNGAVVIGISGATSAGKSTLSLILAEIFTTADMARPESLGSSRISTTARLPPTDQHTCKKKRNLLIHQDLFFYDKSVAEKTTFRSCPADEEFCLMTLERDEVGEYVVERNGRGTFDVYGPDTDRLSAVNMMQLLNAVKGVKEGRGLPCVEELRGESGRVDGGGRVYGMPFTARVTEEEIEFVKREYADVIAAGKVKVAEWTRRLARRNLQRGFDGRIVKTLASAMEVPDFMPTMLFVEGSLLFTRPHETDRPLFRRNPSLEKESVEHEISQSASSAYSHHTPFRSVSQQDKHHPALDPAYALLNTSSQNLSLTSTTTETSRTTTPAKQEHNQDPHYLHLRKALLSLQPLLDIKLFLPTSPSAALTRRMSRKCYIDIKHGGDRKPGQMWKTEGYFDVAWRNHVQSHGRLLDSGIPRDDDKDVGVVGGCKCGIERGIEDGNRDGEVLVREVIDAGVEETVAWALGCVLQRLEGMEDEAFVDMAR